MNFSPGALLTNNRTRILDVFEKWLNELDTIQHVDFQRATVCLHHIARLLEDAVLVPMNSSSLMNDDVDDERFEVLLSRVLLEDYSEVIYNAFRSMVTTADTNYQNACLRVVVILKLTSREIGDLFAEVLPMTELEDFVKEQINHPNELLRARVGFLLGEMLLEEKNLPDIPIETILQPRIPRIKELRLLLEEKSDELIEAMAHVHEIAKYTSNASIPIPEPDSPTPDASIWGVDECGTEGTALHYLTILNGLLHLTAALIEFSEALAIAVSESLLKECIEILKLPAVPVQTFCMILIGNALIHRKLAMDFIELDGPSEVYRLIDTYRHGPTKGDFETFSSHATFIISSIFKHSSAVDLYVKPTNAHQIVGFMFSLFNNWDSLGTNLNILEWCAEAIHHPLLLRVIHAANFWKKVKSICDSLIRMKTNPDRKADSMFFLEHFRSVTVLALKYIVAHMFWGYQYSKSLFSDMDDLKPLSKSFGTLIRKNYVGQAGTVDIVQALSSSPAVIKIDEAEMYALEAYVFKSLIRTGHLPKGMTLDLFGGDGYVSSTSQQFFASAMQTASSVHEATAAAAAATTATTTAAGAATAAATGNANTTSYDPLAAFNFQVEPIGYYSSSPSAAATTAAAAAAATSSADVDYDAQSVVSMVTKVLPEWTIVDAAIREGIVPALFHILMLENKDSTTVCMALLCLQLLCVDAAAIVEVMQYDLAKHFDAATIQNTSELAAFQYKKGLEVLLYSVTSQERRDPSVMVSVLRLLAAMSAAPYFRYNGHDSSVAHSFFEDYLKSPYFAATQLPPHHQHHPLAEKKKPLFDTAKKQISSKLAYNALENVQRSVRKAIRAHAGISILTQMLYYKKNVTFSIPIRLETLKILLGLQQDDDIRQILVKLRLPTVLENQIQAEKSQSNMYDMNTIPQKLHDRALLQFYTDNLVNLLRGVAIGGIGGAVGVGGGVGGGIDATGLSLLDDAQEHLLRKTVVDHSNIEFSQFELLYLIRDHLAAMGLTKSATTLEAELIEREQQANQRQKMYGSSSSSGTKPAASTTTDSHHKAGSHTSGSRLAALTRQASIERRLSGIHLPEGPSAAVVDDAAVAEAEGETAPGSKKRLREVIETPAAAVDVTEDSATTAHASSSSVSSAKRLSVAFAAVATNAGPDGDGDDDPTSSPPPLKYSSSARKAATAAVAPLAGSALKRLPSSGTTATAAAAAAAAVQATPTAAAASVATATPGTRGGGGSTLAPLLPLAKSQRRKNIARALKADTCSYVLPAVVAPAKSAQTTAMTPAMAPSAMSTSPRPLTMPSSSSSSSSSAAVAGGSFVTPSVTRYPHHHHHHHHPHHHAHHSVTSATSTGAAAASTSTALSTSSSTAAHQSKLSAIMRRYLRLQHCQCKHPVSTLPVMSLLKPHVCPKPPPIQFYNINRIVHRYQPICGNAQWMRHYRHDVQAGQLHHLYASYRTVMTEEEDGYMVTACAFGQQPHRLWLGWYNYDNGAEVTMVDTSQQDTLGEAYDLDLPGMIDSFVFPDMHYSASAAFAQPQQPILATMIQSHMITQGQTAGKEVYLYRDRDSAEVFQSPALHKLSITAEDIRQVMAASQPGYTVPTSTLVDDDLRCFESIAFSRETGRYLAASMVNDVLPMGAAFVFDVESGVVVHRLLNEASGGSGGGPMYAYPQVHYVPEEDQVLWFDGKLFDLRTNATLHRFDKLSQYGNAAFHPNGYDVIIDSAIWDLRMFALRQTVPLLENCRVQFDRFGGGLIAAMSMKDDDRPFASIREEYLGFHVLHPGDYSHIHTQNVVKAGQVSGYGLAEVQVDRHGGGLVAGILLAGAQEATMSQCKVLEIGLRKRTADDDGLDGEEDSDEDDDWHGSSDDDEDDDEEDEDEAGQDEMSVDDDSDEDEDEDEDDEGRGGRHDNDDDEGRRGENDEDDGDDEDDEDYEDIEGSAEEDDGDWETDSDDSGEDYETVSEDDDDDDEDGGDEEGDEDGDAGAGDGPRAGAPARPSRQTPTGGRGGAAFPRRAGSGGGGGGGYSRR